MVKLLRKYKNFSSLSKSFISATGLSVITLGLIVTTLLVQQNQDFRSKAATSGNRAPQEENDQPNMWLRAPHGVQDQGGTYLLYVEWWADLPVIGDPYPPGVDYYNLKNKFHLSTSGTRENPPTWDFSCASPPQPSCVRNITVENQGGNYSVYAEMSATASGGLTTQTMGGPGQKRLGYFRIIFGSTHPGCVSLNPDYADFSSHWQVYGEGDWSPFSAGHLVGVNTCTPSLTPTPIPSATPTMIPTFSPTPTIGVTSTPTNTPSPVPTLTPCTIINNGASMDRSDALRISGNYGENVTVQNLTTGVYLVNNLPYTLDASQSICGGDGYVQITSTVCSPDIQFGNVIAAISSDGSTDTVVISSDGCSTTPTPTSSPTPSPSGDCQCDLWYVTENGCGSSSVPICTGNFSCSCAVPGQSPGWCGDHCSNNSNCQSGLTCNQTTFTCGGSACSEPTPTSAANQEKASSPSVWQRTLNFFRRLF